MAAAQLVPVTIRSLVEKARVCVERDANIEVAARRHCGYQIF